MHIRALSSSIADFSDFIHRSFLLQPLLQSPPVLSLFLPPYRPPYFLSFKRVMSGLQRRLFCHTQFRQSLPYASTLSVARLCKSPSQRNKTPNSVYLAFHLSDVIWLTLPCRLFLRTSARSRGSGRGKRWNRLLARSRGHRRTRTLHASRLLLVRL